MFQYHCLRFNEIPRSCDLLDLPIVQLTPASLGEKVGSAKPHRFPSNGLARLLHVSFAANKDGYDRDAVEASAWTL